MQPPHSRPSRAGSALRRATAPRGGARGVRLLVLALAIVLAFAATEGAAQEPPAFAPKSAPKTSTTLEDLGFGDTAINGARASRDFFFSGAGDYELGDANKIIVELAHSNLLDPQRSVMNVVLNGRPLQTVRLDEKNVNFGRLEIPVPKDLVAKDFNRLTFNFGMTTGLLCEDPFSPALFTNILKRTAFQIAFATNPPTPRIEDPNLAAYPYPFFRAGYPVVAPVTIAIPDNPNETELTGAYRLAADLATKVFFDLELLSIRPVSAISQDDLRNQQVIAVGRPDRNPIVRRILENSPFVERSGGISRDNQTLNTDWGVLLLRASPYNGSLRALAVTGQNESAVRRSVDALTSEEPAALLAGPQAVLTEPVQAPAVRDFQSIFTFRDAGARETTLRGGGEQTFDVVFSSPAPAPGTVGKLDLVLSVPDGLDRRRSNVVVELNDHTIATVRLNADQARRGSYKVDLPSDVLKVGPNTLRLKSTLYDPEPLILEACESSAPERFWITLHEDSAVSLPQAAGSSTATDLASLPFPFAGLLGLRETTFVVDERDNNALRAGMLATITLGRRVGAINDFNVVPARTATAEQIGDRHVVAIAVPRDSTLGQQLEKVLPLVLRPDGTRALVEEKGTLAEILDASRIGAIQMVAVPWATNRRLLAVTGTDDTALNWAAEALPRGGLNGNVALFQSARQVNTFSLQRLSDAELEKALRDRFTERDAREATLLAGLLVGLGAIVLLILWALRRRLTPRSIRLRLPRPRLRLPGLPRRRR